MKDLQLSRVGIPHLSFKFFIRASNPSSHLLTILYNNLQTSGLCSFWRHVFDAGRRENLECFIGHALNSFYFLCNLKTRVILWFPFGPTQRSTLRPWIRLTSLNHLRSTYILKNNFLRADYNHSRQRSFGEVLQPSEKNFSDNASTNPPHSNFDVLSRPLRISPPIISILFYHIK